MLVNAAVAEGITSIATVHDSFYVCRRGLNGSSSLITRPVRPFSPYDPLGLMPKQFPSGFLVAVLLTASGLLWAVMFFGPLAHLSRLSGGMTPFDIRPWGYSYAEARAFLEAIGAEGRAAYASPELAKHI